MSTTQEAKHNTGEVIVLPLEELLQSYDPAPLAVVDESLSRSEQWDDCLKMLEKDDIVQRLMQERLQAVNGLFEQPVVVYYSSEEYDEEDDVHYPESYSVANGMHRIAATYFSGGDSILVRKGWENTVNDDEYTFTYIYVKLVVDTAKHDLFNSDDWWDDLDTSFSWRVNGNPNLPWLTMESLNGQMIKGTENAEFFIYFEPNFDIDKLKASFTMIADDVSNKLKNLSDSMVEIALKQDTVQNNDEEDETSTLMRKQF